MLVLDRSRYSVIWHGQCALVARVGYFDMPHMLQRLACKAVIIANSKKILVLREAAYDEGTNAGRYILPGGRIEPGEPFLDGLKREVAEETGLRLRGAVPLYVGEWFPAISGQQNHIVAVFFACRATSSHVRLSDEHNGYEWIRPEDYQRYDLVVPEGEVIEAYLRYRRAGIAM